MYKLKKIKVQKKFGLVNYIYIAGEIGIYFAIYDAKAENPKSYGSERFYLMDLTDKLFDHLVATDIVKLREDLERKGVLEGAYLERFSRGEYFVPFVISFFNANFYRRIIDHYRANQSFTSRWIVTG